MKKLYIITTISFLLNIAGFSQNVGINSIGAQADPSALLDLSSTDKGFLITRADTASIASPAFGLMTLAPTDSCLYLYNGVKWIGMGGGGSSCTCNCSNSTSSSSSPTLPPGTVLCVGVSTVVNDVTSTTGVIWMDRNMGASQVATSLTDAAAYGDLYQWGRFADGHQCRTSAITTTNATTETPNLGNSWDGLFIKENSSPYDWVTPQNNMLWQGVNGTNNPCPSGYRLPTETELETEQLSWLTNDASGAYNSSLKLTMGGFHHRNSNVVSNVGTYAAYWSSTVGGSAKRLVFQNASASMGTNARAYAFSIRCIKD